MKVAVLGNGQLGAMLQEAGLRIGVDVTTLNIDGDTLPDNDTIITAEREHWPTNAFTQAIENHPNWLNKATFAALANRISQKKLLRKSKTSHRKLFSLSAICLTVEI